MWDGLGWGFLLWLAGYVLGIALFPFVPGWAIGWIIIPIGIVLTILVLLKKVDGPNLTYYMKLAIIWVLIAIVFDYIFMVVLLNPADGYYKLDVYLYYLLMFILPVAIGFKKVDMMR